MLRIEVLRPSELTPELVGAWRAFQAADPDIASPFLTPEWVQAVAAARGENAARIAVQFENDRPVGFFACRPGAVTASPVGAPLSDYQAVIAARGADIDVRPLLRALDVARYDFSHAPVSQRSLARGMRGRHTSWCVDLTGGWDGYLAELKSHGSGLPRDLGKRWRRMEREFGEVRFTAANTDRADFDAMIRHKRVQYAETRQTDVLGRGWTQRLLHDLRDRRDAGFGGLFSTLHVGGKLAAGHLGLYANGVFHAWFVAHDRELGRHSPGVLLLAEIVRHLGEQGGWRELDFGTGDYPFKLRMATASRELGYGYVGRPAAATALRGAAYWVRQRAEAAPLGRVSALPGKAMRRWDVIRSLGG